MRLKYNAWIASVGAIVSSAVWATSPYDSIAVPTAHLSSTAVGECGAYSGGLAGGSSCEFAINGQLELHGDHLVNWQGASLVMSLEATGGGKPSANFVGDAQGVSNVEAKGALRPYEFYFSQRFAATGTALQVGLIDINDQFLNVPGTSELINASFGLIPTISLNVPVSTYPKPGWGATVEQTVGRRWQLRAGLFQGNPNDRSNPFHSGAFAIAAAEYQSADGFDLQTGLWRYAAPNDQGYGAPGHDWGMQASLAQSFNDDACIAFTQLGISPSTASFNPYYLEAGLRWQGLVKSRPHDSVVTAVAHALLRGTGGRHAETAFELAYNLAITPDILLQPDFQYVIHPMGSGAVLPNAFVSFLRFTAFF